MNKMPLLLLVWPKLDQPECLLRPCLVVRKEKSHGNHKEFHVRKQKILHALQWLIENNPFFKDITIAYDVLDELPDDSVLQSIPSLSVDEFCNTSCKCSTSRDRHV